MTSVQSPNAVMTPPKTGLVRGAVIMVAANALVALASLGAKALGTGPDALHPFQVTFGRFLFALIPLLILAAVMRTRIVKPAWPIHLLRVSCGFVGVTCMFTAASLMPLADATAISFLNPMIAMILAIPVLGERVGPWRWAAAAGAMIGALVLIRPGTDAFQPAALFALTAAVVFGVEVTIIKILSGREPPLQILLMSNSIGMVLATIAVSFVWIWPTPTQWALMALVGGSIVAAQAGYIQAMRAAEASFVMPFAYASLIFAALYDFAFYKVVPGSMSLLGAAIIIASALVLAWREARAARLKSVNQNSAKPRASSPERSRP